MLGYSYWQKRFGGDPGAIGRQVRINGAPATIIGVVDSRFHGTFANTEMDGFVPLSYMARSESINLPGFFHDRATPRLTVMGTLKPGVGLAQARSEAEVIARRLEHQYPDTDKGISVWLVPETWARPVPVRAMVAAGPIVAGLFLLLGGLVLVLACMNLSNILLVRAAAREREMAVRAALGSGRGRLVRQVLAESLLLALLGGVAGVTLGAWASDAIASIPIAGSLPSAFDLSFDWRVFAYALAATLLAGAGAGLWPALAASRADVAAVLHECGRSGIRRPGQPPLSQHSGVRPGGRLPHPAHRRGRFCAKSLLGASHGPGIRPAPSRQLHHGYGLQAEASPSPDSKSKPEDTGAAESGWRGVRDRHGIR